MNGVYFLESMSFDPDLVADKNTPVPGQSGTFVNFGNVSVDGPTDNVVFIGRNADNVEGLYAHTASGIIKLIAEAMPLDGRIVDGISFGHEGLDGNQATFRASFTNASEGIYVADIATLSFDIAKTGLYREGEWLLDLNGDDEWNVDDDHLIMPGDAISIPVSGDRNGDGTTETAYFIDGDWFPDINNDGRFVESDDRSFNFGGAASTPVVGDWDGDGKDQAGIHVSGLWLLDVDDDGDFNAAFDRILYYGGPGFVPVVGDWDGDGTDQVGVYRNGLWRTDDNNEGIRNDRTTFFGAAAFSPVVGDYNGYGVDDFSLYRNGLWLIDLDNNGSWNALVDRSAMLGDATYMPVTGKW